MPNEQNLRILNLPTKYTGKNVKIAALDDAPGSTYAIPVNYPPEKCHYHGQGVTYIIKSIAPDAEVYGIDKPSWSFARALNWCIDNSINIVNMSFVRAITDKDVIDRAVGKGLILVAAAGNTGKDDSVGYPANHPNVIAVASYNPQTGQISGFSSAGKQIEIAAPGHWLLPVPNGRWLPQFGTSFAAPVITAVLALYFEAFREIRGRNPILQECREFLYSNAKDIEAPGPDYKSGRGLFIWPENWPPKEVERKMPKVVIDSGHGGLDPGAVGPTGLKEKDVALWVAQRLPLFLPKEVQVSYTREYDENISLERRVYLANLIDADIFISIHCNSASDSAAHGVETYCYQYGGSGERLAKLIQQEIIKLTGLTDRGVKEANFQVLRETKMPAALVEIAFISNPAEETLLKKDSYRLNYCRAIANAIRQYFGFGEYLQPEAEAGGDKTMVGKKVDDEAEVYLNGNKLKHKAIIIEGVSYLPTRELAEALGCKVDWRPGRIDIRKGV